METNQLTFQRHTRIVIKSGTGGHADYGDNSLLVAELGEMPFLPPVGSTIMFQGFLEKHLRTASPYFGENLLVRHIHQSFYVSDKVSQFSVEIEVIPA